MDQSFKPVINLRTAKPPHHAGRGLVGHHQVIDNTHIGHVISAGHNTVLAIEWSRHGWPEIGAVVVPLLKMQTDDLAVIHHRSLGFNDPVGGSDGRGQMFKPVFNPFNRAASFARRYAH